MRRKSRCASIALLIMTAGSAGSYDGLQQDYTACMADPGKIGNAKIVKACSRLIKNAKKENSVIGMFYAMRGFANNDKASNCRDAKKARKLIVDPSLTEALDGLEKANDC